MQKEIKVKAWDKEARKWIGGIMMMRDGNNITQILPTKPNVEIVEFTGLKDATKWEQLTKAEQEEWLKQGNNKDNWNGKEIYEGDIVVFKSGYSFEMKDRNTFIGYVEWIDDNAGFAIKHPIYDYLRDIDIADNIIGNIYENPELLGAK